MGAVSKMLSVASRLLALASSVIVAGLLGSYVKRAGSGVFGAGSRVIYTLALSGISILFALVLLPPLRYSSWAFPLDIIMFIMWIVAFGLLAARSARCNGTWFRFAWTSSWDSRKCGHWRAILAFTFIAAMAWLFNAILGAYKSSRRDKEYETGAAHTGKKGRWGRGSGAEPMTQTANNGVPATAV